jgi:hypothetical protein
MVDTGTFLTTLYVTTDDFCKRQPQPDARPGRRAPLCQSEVITLAVFGQWEHSPSERVFYRWARCHLREAFPSLPHYAQYNRLLRQHSPAIDQFFLYLVELLQARVFSIF